jgi:hypothetical protein
MLPAVQKFLGRVFAHREQECPFAKGSFPRKVNKVRKAGIHESRIPSTEPVLSPGRLPTDFIIPPAPFILATSPSPEHLPNSLRMPARASRSLLTLAPLTEI